MLIKVCGINCTDNMRDISRSGVDMIGINYYAPSKRYIGSTEIDIPDGIARVGVFVDAPMQDIVTAIKRDKLDYVQLHGNESTCFCAELSYHVKIIKAFGVNADFDFTSIAQYQAVDYYLLDTFTKAHGGSGKKFDWTYLKHYQDSIPFILAGGICADDVEDILDIDHPMFAGIDINSRFEIEPGLKNVPLVRDFTKRIKATKGA